MKLTRGCSSFSRSLAIGIFIFFCSDSSLAQDDDQVAQLLDREITEAIRLHESITGGVHPGIREVVRGDLDEDGDEDAAVVYTIEGMGGGNLYEQYLSIFLQEPHGWRPGPAIKVGGKNHRSINIRGITEGSVTLETLSYAAGDASCCPSLKGETHYRLRMVLEEF